MEKLQEMTIEPQIPNDLAELEKIIKVNVSKFQVEQQEQLQLITDKCNQLQSKVKSSQEVVEYQDVKKIILDNKNLNSKDISNEAKQIYSIFKNGTTEEKKEFLEKVTNPDLKAGYEKFIDVVETNNRLLLEKEENESFLKNKLNEMKQIKANLFGNFLSPFYYIGEIKKGFTQLWNVLETIPALVKSSQLADIAKDKTHIDNLDFKYITEHSKEIMDHINFKDFADDEKSFQHLNNEYINSVLNTFDNSFIKDENQREHYKEFMDNVKDNNKGSYLLSYGTYFGANQELVREVSIMQNNLEKYKLNINDSQVINKIDMLDIKPEMKKNMMDYVLIEKGIQYKLNKEELPLQDLQEQYKNTKTMTNLTSSLMMGSFAFSALKLATEHFSDNVSQQFEQNFNKETNTYTKQPKKENKVVTEIVDEDEETHYHRQK